MKNVKTIKTVLCIGFVVLVFASCEPKEEESTSSNEPMKATYSHLGERLSYYNSTHEEDLSWNVQGNTLVIRRDVTHCEYWAGEPRIYTEIVGDTIYVIERWYAYSFTNTVSFRDMEITVTNVPKGKWTINSSLEYPLYVGATPRVYVYSHNVFSIEVE